MRLSIAVRVLLLTGIICYAPVADSAQAMPVTVGSPLAGSFTSVGFGGIQTAANISLGEAGAHVASPVDGTIVRWRITGAMGGPFKLRVLTHVSGTTYTGAGTSSPGSPTSTATQTFTTDMPIRSGQVLGLDDTTNTDQIGAQPVAASNYTVWMPQLADGATAAGSTAVSPNTEIGFNADVQPFPVVSSVSPSAGSTAGGTVVTITGRNFLGTTRVMFGSAPASNFTVLSDTVLVAKAPASAAATIDVRIANPGLSAVSAADHFTFVTPCVVPKLKGKTLKKAKAALKRAHCRLGKVTPHGRKKGRVKKQSPKPGTMLAGGTKVNVTLKR